MVNQPNQFFKLFVDFFSLKSNGRAHENGIQKIRNDKAGSLPTWYETYKAQVSIKRFFYKVSDI